MSSSVQYLQSKEKLFLNNKCCYGECLLFSHEKNIASYFNSNYIRQAVFIYINYNAITSIVVHALPQCSLIKKCIFEVQHSS